MSLGLRIYSLRKYYSTTLFFVFRDRTASEYLEAGVLQDGRGTRGTSSAVSSGDDELVFGNLTQAGFQLADGDMHISRDTAAFVDLLSFPDVQKK